MESRGGGAEQLAVLTPEVLEDLWRQAKDAERTHMELPEKRLELKEQSRFVEGEG
jgi:hypothetical protein